MKVLKTSPGSQLLMAGVIAATLTIGITGCQPSDKNEPTKAPTEMTEVDLGELAADQNISALSIPKNAVLSGSFDDKGELRLEMKVKFNRDGKAVHEAWTVVPAAKKMLVMVPETSMLKTATPIKAVSATTQESVNEQTKK